MQNFSWKKGIIILIILLSWHLINRGITVYKNINKPKIINKTIIIKKTVPKHSYKKLKYNNNKKNSSTNIEFFDRFGIGADTPRIYRVVTFCIILIFITGIIKMLIQIIKRR